MEESGKYGQWMSEICIDHPVSPQFYSNYTPLCISMFFLYKREFDLPILSHMFHQISVDFIMILAQDLLLVCYILYGLVLYSYEEVFNSHFQFIDFCSLYVWSDLFQYW